MYLSSIMFHLCGAGTGSSVPSLLTCCCSRCCCPLGDTELPSLCTSIRENPSTCSTVGIWVLKLPRKTTAPPTTTRPTHQPLKKKAPFFSSPRPTPPSKSTPSPSDLPTQSPQSKPQHRNHSTPFNHCFFPSLTPFMVPLKVLAGQRRRAVTEETLAH